MKKLIVLLVVALLITATFMSACGVDFASTYVDIYSSAKYKDALTQRTHALNDYRNINVDFSPITISGNLGVFRKSITDSANYQYMIYNFNEETAIASYDSYDTRDYDIGLLYALDYDFYFVRTKTRQIISNIYGGGFSYSNWSYDDYVLYSAGNEHNRFSHVVATSKTQPKVNVDAIMLDNNPYRLDKNGELQLAGSRAENAVDLPVFEAKNNKNYYDIKSSKIFIYKEDYTLMHCYELPSYCSDQTISILDDGNVLIQYRYEESMFSQDYTYYDPDSGKNITIVTEIFDVDKGEAKEITADYVVLDGILSRNTMYSTGAVSGIVTVGVSLDTIGSGVKNLAAVKYIKNKRLSNNNDDIKIVSIKNNGDIDYSLFDIFPAQSGAPEQISSGKFIVSDKAGSKLLVDGKGNVIADVTGYSDFNEKYILLDKKIYDHDMNLIMSYKDLNYNVEKVMNNAVLFSTSSASNSGTKKNYIIFSNDVFKSISTPETATLFAKDSRYFVIKNTIGTLSEYNYYNENGEKLLTTDYALSHRGTSIDGKMLFTGYDTKNEKYVNYIFVYTPEQSK